MDIGLITGTKLNCANWQIEGLLRMLRNNVMQGAIPEELIIYGGTGKAARNVNCYDAIEAAIRRLEPDETMIVQSGKVVYIAKTHVGAPRALIVNSMLVPQWSTYENHRKLEKMGLTMYGQMTAGSWAFIGQQGIMQGTYETFAAAGAKKRKFILTSGCGNMGGAQAPAGVMCGAVTLIAEIDPSKISRCQAEGWIDEVFPAATDDDDEDILKALRRAVDAAKAGEAVAIAVQANIIDVLHQALQHNIIPDIVTDQTAAHDLLNGYFPVGLSFEDAMKMRQKEPNNYIEKCMDSTRLHVSYLLELQSKGATVFDYGNGLRFHAEERGVANAFDIKGFVPLYVRPLFCQGRGPFRVAALSGDPRDIEVVDSIILELFEDNDLLVNWIKNVQGAIDFSKQPGLPARVCWLGMGERAKAVEWIWRAVRRGHIKAPIWVGRDHLDCGSVASPGRETEAMMDGSDAISDWPILNALLNAVSGATWVSVHNGGGVGIGKATHAGQCFVITPEPDCLERALRVFTHDPGIGVARHADAGYPDAIETAREHNIDIPMITDLSSG